MDISPKLLREVEFREQWRGYNPEEVDEFLERLALGLEELQARLADVSQRAAAAERRLLDRSDEDELRRTLVLAQRTATATIDEARADAERLVQEAEERSRQLVADAEAQAAQLDAELEARRRDELGGLADEHARLRAEVDELRRFADGQRARIAAALRELEGGLVVPDPPAVTAPAPPAHEPAPGAVADVDDGVVIDEPEEPFVIDDDDAGDAAVDLADARAELAAALDRAGVDASGPTVFDDAADETGQFDVLADVDADADADGGADGGEPEQPAWRDEHDDDPFLAELRKAVVDDGPLGPREDEPPRMGTDDSDAEADDDALSSGGFFRRGRRRG